MAQPTKEELEARRDAIDVQLTRLINLPAQYNVGQTTVNNTDLITTLRQERDHIERAIRSIDEPNINAMQGPELIVT